MNKTRLKRWIFWGLVGLFVFVLIIAGLLIYFVLSGRGLSIPTRLDDLPAPTTIPLSDYSKSGGINLPPGFQLSRFAEGLDGPRMMALGPDGMLYVTERGKGRVVRLPDRDGDGQADGVEVVLEGLSAPSGLAFYQDGSLYVAEPGRVYRFLPQSQTGMFADPEVLIDGIPTSGHNTRTLLFSPDWRYLYVSIGSSCNVCVEDDPRRAAIVRYNPEGSGETLYAVGLRNAVGLVLRPGTEEIWATNNGADWLGDNLPPETVNQISEGADFGWPRCHAGRIVDPEFGGSDACLEVTPPGVEIQAHSAPLGLAFYTGQNFPPEYQGDLFVALHGSWNRSEPTGYKVVRIPFGDGSPGQVTEFAWGWLTEDGEQRWGRPVDVLVGTDGALYVSDDFGGVIFRIFYSGS
jgi:glucose/arabinose dehydrogenase